MLLHQYLLWQTHAEKYNKLETQCAQNQDQLQVGVLSIHRLRFMSIVTIHSSLYFHQPSSARRYLGKCNGGWETILKRIATNASYHMLWQIRTDKCNKLEMQCAEQLEQLQVNWFITFATLFKKNERKSADAETITCSGRPRLRFAVSWRRNARSIEHRSR